MAQSEEIEGFANQARRVLLWPSPSGVSGMLSGVFAGECLSRQSSKPGVLSRDGAALDNEAVTTSSRGLSSR